MKNVILLAAAVFLLLLVGSAGATDVGTAGMRNGTTVTIQSGGQSYPAYITTPEDGGPFPAVVLIHSFNGLEPGYQDMVDRMATEGFVVIAPEWQTFEEAPADNVTEALVRDTVAYLETRPEVNSSSIGLTGFCAGGRYTMLFLPRIEEFSAGVAWYGFPYSGGQANGSPPAEFVESITDRRAPSAQNPRTSLPAFSASVRVQLFPGSVFCSGQHSSVLCPSQQ